MRQFIVWISLLVSSAAFAADIFERNDISLFDNRFRIDREAEKVTFVIKRDEGSSAVILVRPDGSKLYSDRKPDNVSWLEGDYQDYITIENPMPGPWQAIGAIDAENRIRIMSKLELDVSPIAQQLFVGEHLKLKAALLTQDKQVLAEDYLDDLYMSVTLTSLNQEEDDNFAFSGHVSARYWDNGRDYDERPGDGEMTAFVKLKIPAGKYRVQVATENEVFTRAFQKDVLVYPIPVKLDVISATQDLGPKLVVVIDDDELQIQSVSLVGQIEGALGEQKQITVQAEQKKFEVQLEKPDVTGRFTIDAMAYATTLSGREIVIELPQEEFRIVPPPPTVELIPESDAVATVEVEESYAWIYISAGGVILLLIIAGGALIWWKRRSVKRIAAKIAENEQEDVALDPTPLEQEQEKK